MRFAAISWSKLSPESVLLPERVIFEVPALIQHFKWKSILSILGFDFSSIAQLLGM